MCITVVATVSQLCADSPFAAVTAAAFWGNVSTNFAHLESKTHFWTIVLFKK